MRFLGNIVFPEGGGGNHLRWLLFLDPLYQDPFGNLQTAEQRADFAVSTVYGSDRTWNTWLRAEWYHRPLLDGQINISHYYSELDRLRNEPTVFVMFDNVELPVTHYFHINLSLNCHTADEARARLLQRHQDMLKLQQEQRANWMFVTADGIFDSDLDPELYNPLIDFFGFSNNYQQACRVHAAYTACRQRSARDFVAYFHSAEFRTYTHQLLSLSKSS